MTLTLIRRLFGRAALTAAYMTCLLQWLWLFMVGIPNLVQSGAIDFITAKPELVQTPASQPIEMSPLVWVLVGSVTLLLLVVTVIVLIRIPRTIVSTGEKIVHHTTEAIMPAITHHRPLPAKKRLALSARLILTIQLVMVLTPLVISYFLPPYAQITSQIILTLALWLAAISTVGFVVARLLLPPSTTSRIQSHASRG
jgi:hypothetical protein